MSHYPGTSMNVENEFVGNLVPTSKNPQVLDSCIYQRSMPWSPQLTLSSLLIQTTVPLVGQSQYAVSLVFANTVLKLRQAYLMLERVSHDLLSRQTVGERPVTPKCVKVFSRPKDFDGLSRSPL